MRAARADFFKWTRVVCVLSVHVWRVENTCENNYTTGIMENLPDGGGGIITLLCALVSQTSCKAVPKKIKKRIKKKTNAKNEQCLLEINHSGSQRGTTNSYNAVGLAGHWAILDYSSVWISSFSLTEICKIVRAANSISEIGSLQNWLIAWTDCVLG